MEVWTRQNTNNSADSNKSSSTHFRRQSRNGSNTCANLRRVVARHVFIFRSEAATQLGHHFHAWRSGRAAAGANGTKRASDFG